MVVVLWDLLGGGVGGIDVGTSTAPHPQLSSSGSVPCKSFWEYTHSPCGDHPASLPHAASRPEEDPGTVGRPHPKCHPTHKKNAQPLGNNTPPALGLHTLSSCTFLHIHPTHPTQFGKDWRYPQSFFASSQSPRSRLQGAGLQPSGVLCPLQPRWRTGGS